MEMTRNGYIHAVYHMPQRLMTMDMMESSKTMDVRVAENISFLGN